MANKNITADTWFVPLIGLRRGRQWRGLLGLELQPMQPPSKQTPRWRRLAWNESPDADTNTIKDCFNDAFGPLPDQLRYIGRWLPTKYVNPANQLDYGKAYDAARYSSIGSFDQAVFVAWSESIGNEEHKPKWIEGALLFLSNAEAKVSDDGLTASVTGDMQFPAGFPARDVDYLTAARATLSLEAPQNPDWDGPFSYRYAKMSFAGVDPNFGDTLKFERFDSDWDGYASTPDFSRLLRLGCNSRICAASQPQDLGTPVETLSDSQAITWSQDSSQEGTFKYRASLRCYTRPIIPDPSGPSEVVQRSYALIDSLRSIQEDPAELSSALDQISWVPADFENWFTHDDVSEELYFYVQAKFSDRLKWLMNHHAGDLSNIIHDGTLGDSVSFAPTVDSMSPSKGRNSIFLCTVSGLSKGDPFVRWDLANETETSQVTAIFTRFCTYDPQTCNRSALIISCDAAVLPLFKGKHGLDLQWFIVQTQISTLTDFRRSEGSLTLAFKHDGSFQPGSRRMKSAPESWTGIHTKLDCGRIHSGRRRLCDGDGGAETNPFLKIEGLKIPVQSVSPYTRDLRPAELLSSIDENDTSEFVDDPILIQLEEISEQPYTLEVNEACEPPRVRNLRLELSRDALEPGSLFGVGKFLVLDRTPFLFARVDLPTLAQNDGFNSGVVARRVIDTETGQPEWEIALDTTTTDAAVQVMLPPQAIGEEMLHDKKPPAPLPNGNTSLSLFAYRFGAPGRLNLAPTYNAQRYAPIPWNLRRLFGYTDQRDPGAELKTMEFELLYGLTANFSAKDAEQTVRVAELFARLGSLVSGLPAKLPWEANTEEQKAWGMLGMRWRTDSRRFAARLGILAPWSPMTPTDLILSKGLQMAPRMQPPLPESAGNSHGEQAGDPQGAQIYFPPDRLSQVSSDVQNLHQRDPLKGVHGGFPWGMQDWEAPYYQLFWDNRRSSSAEVRDLCFSSLGGWGQQVARFASNRLLVQARVAMGRTHIYTVERIGKIAVFGHKAKHVIRYERSVIPSPYSMDFAQSQDPLLGRPVVRKVEEYIELIQDRKDYPDHASGQTLDTGLVQACYFPGKGARIPINPTWGRSWNNGIEWEVPLWRANANPLLYPKPEIFIEMSAGSGADMRPVAQTIANPQDVYFYTTAQKDLTDDVSTWPQVNGVDYLNSEEPTEWNIDDQFPDQDSVPDTGWPEAVSTPPGFRRFTFHLDPAQDEVNLVANRRDDVMLHGRVRNVTMMRSAPRQQANAGKPGAPISIIKSTVANAIVTITTAKPHALITGQVVLIEGHSKATINGTWKITVPNNSTTTFTFPINVTVAGSGGTGGTVTDAEKIAANNISTLRAWQRKVHLGLSETRSLITKNPTQAAAQLDGTLAALKARLPSLPKLPPLDSGSPLTPCTSTSNPLLGRAISLVAEDIRKVLVTRGQGLVDDAFRPLKNQLAATTSALIQQQDQFKQLLHTRLHEAIDTLNSVIFYVAFAPEQLLEQLDQQLDHAFSAPLDRAEQLVDLCNSKLEELATNAEHYLDQFTTEGLAELDSLETRVIAVWQRADELFGNLTKTIQKLPDTGLWTNIKPKCLDSLRTTQKILSDFKDALTRAAAPNQPAGLITAAHDAFQAAANTGAAAIAKLLRDLESAITAAAEEPLKEVRSSLLLLRQEIRQALNDNTALSNLQTEVKSWTESVKKGLETLDGQIDQLSNDAQKLFAEANAAVDQSIKDLKDQAVNLANDCAQKAQDLFCPLAQLDLGLPDVIGAGLQAVDDLLAVEDAWNKLKGLNYTNSIDLQKGLDELDALEHRLGVEASWLGDQVMPVAHNIVNAAADLQYAAQDASEVLRTVRAVCNDLRTDGLGLNRKTVAMILNFRAPTISLTPTLTRLKQFGQDLGALGLRLPTTELADRFVPNPDWLKTFDLNRIVSDCGGARLAGLLQRLKTPAISDRLRVTQGLNKQTLRAWIRAEVDFPLTGKHNLFDFGPIAVVLDDANFNAYIRAEVDATGRLTKDAFGEISADWVLMTGGQELVAFQDTQLTFQNGRMHFDLDPKKIRLGGLLKMISDLTEVLPSPGGDDGPLKVAWLKETVAGFEVPAGVRATLELPSIDLGSTPVAVTGLQLGGFLELRALQKNPKGVEFDFGISLGFHLSRKDKPFNVAIFCLGGGGWVDSGLVYKPLHSDLTAAITVGVEASASLSFNLGWLSGGVGIYLGLFIEFHHGTQAGTTFHMGLMIRLEGHLDLLGIIEVYLTILLEAVYNVASGTKTLQCTGTVDVSIKICWCFTLHVHRSFTYSMGAGTRTLRTLTAETANAFSEDGDPYQAAAEAYLAMFA
jgi:hypothetical protein